MEPVAPLGRELAVALVDGRADRRRLYGARDLDALGLSPREAYAVACRNLSAIFRAGLDGRRVAGPRATKILVLQHALAASFLLLPNLARWARRLLDTREPTLGASIPRHDMLVLYPDLGSHFREEIAGELAPRADPLTTEVFFLDVLQRPSMRRTSAIGLPA
ncbi:MAG: hypothetical protein KF819_11940 [Labilithrix sp.]|nr:hypothetical protein [Labilithrix sp.]